ncbi:MAG TPA: hypothetical protein VFQ61_21725, partial [Polyangiaceae bacterium]|nr:hypothetical protein [Polyangiaceae bacterium]
MRASFVESRTGRHYTRNYDRFVADATTPLIAVVDSECDDGMSGDVVANALKRSGAGLARHLDAPAERV